MRRIVMLLLGLTAAVSATGLVTACGKDPVVESTALQLEAPLLGGGKLDFRSLAGSTVALWFWAPG